MCDVFTRRGFGRPPCVSCFVVTDEFRTPEEGRSPNVVGACGKPSGRVVVCLVFAVLGQRVLQVVGTTGDKSVLDLLNRTRG